MEFEGQLTYNEVYADFQNDKEKYFDIVGSSFPWIKKYTRVYDFKDPFYEYYPDGQINACYTALDHHVVSGRGE